MIPTFDGLIFLFGFWWFIVGAGCGALAGFIVAVFVLNAGQTSRWEERRAAMQAMDELAKRRRVG